MQSRIGRAAVIAAGLGWSVVGLPGAFVAAQTYTVEVTIDPGSRRHYAEPGWPQDAFDCSYAPFTVDLSSYTDIAFDFSVAGGGFIASTIPGEVAAIAIDDTTAAGSCSFASDSSTARTDVTDAVWKGIAVPATSSTHSWFDSSPLGALSLSADTAEASDVFQLTGVSFTRPSIPGSSQTHQACRCGVYFSALRGVDVSLVWGPSVPRNVGPTVVTTVAAGATQCPHGGVVVLEGHDDGYGGGIPGDDIVEPAEAEQTQTVCSGSDLSSLVSTGPAGASCPHGGTRIDTGLDDGADGGVAGDGILEPGEVQHSAFVCNGASGCSVAPTPASCRALAGLFSVPLLAAMVRLRRRRMPAAVR